jgi:hypothetical protein
MRVLKRGNFIDYVLFGVVWMDALSSGEAGCIYHQDII